MAVLCRLGGACAPRRLHGGRDPVVGEVWLWSHRRICPPAQRRGSRSTRCCVHLKRFYWIKWWWLCSLFVWFGVVVATRVAHLQASATCLDDSHPHLMYHYTIPEISSYPILIPSWLWWSFDQIIPSARPGIGKAVARLPWLGGEKSKADTFGATPRHG